MMVEDFDIGFDIAGWRRDLEHAIRKADSSHIRILLDRMEAAYAEADSARGYWDLDGDDDDPPEAAEATGEAAP